VVTTIDAASLEMDEAPTECIDIVKGPQFLDTAKFPKIVFRSGTSARDRREVAGNLRQPWTFTE